MAKHMDRSRVTVSWTVPARSQWTWSSGRQGLAFQSEQEQPEGCKGKEPGAYHLLCDVRPTSAAQLPRDGKGPLGCEGYMPSVMSRGPEELFNKQDQSNLMMVGEHHH